LFFLIQSSCVFQEAGPPPLKISDRFWMNLVMTSLLVVFEYSETLTTLKVHSLTRKFKNLWWCFFVLFKRVLGQGPEQRESKLIVLSLPIFILLISYIIIYFIIIKLLIMENHHSQNQERNSCDGVDSKYYYKLLTTILKPGVLTFLSWFLHW
jgi:hypothetical protein